MVTNCPKCHKPNEHEDFMFEVLCECGSRFNPFMSVHEEPAADEPPSAAPIEAPAAPAWQELEPEANFSESQSVLDEIREFAETGNDRVALSVNSSVPLAPSAAPAPTRSAAPRPPAAGGEETIMTSGDGLPGYRIESYLSPVSAAAELDAADPNPMRKGFDALWDQARQAGGNGMVGVRWVLSPDGSRVILSGTPVHCLKEGT